MKERLHLVFLVFHKYSPFPQFVYFRPGRGCLDFPTFRRTQCYVNQVILRTDITKNSNLTTHDTETTKLCSVVLTHPAFESAYLNSGNRTLSSETKFRLLLHSAGSTEMGTHKFLLQSDYLRGQSVVNSNIYCLPDIHNKTRFIFS
jgi:hypothetical protein